jgi:Ala-tRNA(Pro) deacylase
VAEDVLQRIHDWLRAAGIAFRQVQHAPTFTSEESARARGEDLRVGGKALVLKLDDQFQLFVLSAARKLDSSAIKKHFHVKKLRFASAAELQQMTGLTQGEVPPFGPPILPFALNVDESILENELIAFNAGSLTTSIIMPVRDYIRIAAPAVLKFSQ